MIGRRRFVQDDSAQWLARALRGDRKAVAKLVTAQSPAMLRLANRMLNDPAEAEDVVQDAFLRLWRKADDWREGRAKLSTWLHRVTLNLCYDRLRKSKPDYGDVPDIADDVVSAPERLAKLETAARVRAAIAALPPRQRAAIALYHLEALSNIDAAAAMEISVEALESLLARGRRALRAVLMDESKEMLESMEQ